MTHDDAMIMNKTLKRIADNLEVLACGYQGIHTPMKRVNPTSNFLQATKNTHGATTEKGLISKLWAKAERAGGELSYEEESYEEEKRG